MIKLNKKFLDVLNANYRSTSLSFTKEQKRFNSGKNSLRGRLIGFMTPEYYKRDRLFEKGEIIYGYLYRSLQTSIETDQVLTWIITSPETYYKESPNELSKIATSLAEIDLATRTNDKKLKQFYALLQEKYASISYLEIPSQFTDGHLAFLTVVPFRTTHLSSFRHGINLMLADSSISKEMFFLPECYWPLEYKEYYYDETNE